jgi:hypothetical protein
MPEQTPTQTPFEQSATFAEDLATCFALKDMIDKIPELSTEPLQDVAWEAIAALLLASTPPIAEA